MIKQGWIFMADLNPVKWHEQAWFRPVLVMQNNILNNNLNTVVVAPITSNLKAKWKITTYYLDKKKSKLAHDSVVLLFQIRTIDKVRLKKNITILDDSMVNEIKKQFQFVF